MTEGEPSVPTLRRSTAAPFMGRDEELATLCRLCGAERLVTVVGPGGGGKTRLATEALAGVAPTVLGVVELATRVPGDDLWSVVLAACGIRDDPALTPAERFAQRIGDLVGGGDALVMLDNCEHVRDAVAELVVAVLSRSPRLRVLATSRLSLGVPGETTLPVDGLPLEEATALFLDRARRVRPDLPDTEDTARRARRIAGALEGLPLALELAAARARGLPLRVIEDSTADRLAFLAVGEHREPRHRSLQACLAWSTALLSERARSGLAAVSVIEGRWSLDAAVAAIGPPRAEEEADAVGVVEELVDHSLVRFLPADAGSYLVLETIREHAREVDPDEPRRALARLAPWVSALAAQARPALERADLDVLARLDADAAAIRAVLTHATAGDDRVRGPAAGVVADLAFWWSLRGRCREGLDRAARVSAALTNAGEPVPGRLRWTHAFHAIYSGLLEEGLGLASAVAEDPAVLEDVRARAMILLGLAQGLDDPVGAAPVLTEAAELAVSAGDLWARVEALQVLACTHVWRGDHAAALACVDATLPPLDELGHQQLRAWDAAIRADAARLRGEMAAVLEHGRAALTLAVEVGEPVSASWALLAVVRGLCRTGRAEEAAGMASDHAVFLDEHPGLAAAEFLDVSRAHMALWSDPPGDPEGLLASLEAWVDHGLTVLAAEAGGVLAAALLAAGETERALALAERARAQARDRDAPEFAVAAGLVHAAARRARGEDVTVEAHEALATAHEAGFTFEVLDALELVAGLTLDAGRAQATLRLHAAADAARRKRGLVVSPLARFVLDTDAAQAAVDDAERERARSEGASLDLDAAVAIARRARGPRGRPRSGWDSLTPTERDVVTLAARGLRNQAIADQLLIGTGTVRTHLRRIFTKLDLTSRAELAAAAARQGL